MKQFIFHVTLFTLCFIAVIVFLLIILPYNKNRYMRAYAKKIDLLENVKQPRMILVGGSSTGFGFNSYLIQDSLKINVINCGLHAGIGLKFMMDDIQYYAKKGDIIILTPEYFHFFEEFDYSELVLADIILKIAPSKIEYLNFSQRIDIINNMSAHIKSNILYIIDIVKNTLFSNQSQSSNSIYTLDAFNDRGDIVKHKEWANITFKSEAFDSEEGVNKNTLNYLKSKIDILQKKGCYVYLLPAIVNISRYELPSVKSDLDILNKKLLNENIGYISDYQKYVFSDSLFYDNSDHLSYEGAMIRSIQFVSDIKKILPPQK